MPEVVSLLARFQPGGMTILPPACNLIDHRETRQQTDNEKQTAHAAILATIILEITNIKFGRHGSDLSRAQLGQAECYVGSKRSTPATRGPAAESEGWETPSITWTS